MKITNSKSTNTNTYGKKKELTQKFSKSNKRLKEINKQVNENERKVGLKEIKANTSNLQSM